MPIKNSDKVDLSRLAERRGGWLGAQGRDPQNDPDFDMDPPVQRKRFSGGLCSNGKRIFWNERLANRAVTNAAKRGELPPMRHYACPDCGYWHLSRKSKKETA